MRVALPHMGNLFIAFKGAFERLGVEYVQSPQITRRTLSLAVKHSPEGSACRSR
jgi:predicted nucleotide-binding protein (sugar kinase/HSP70/actin superfamily)